MSATTNPIADTFTSAETKGTHDGYAFARPWFTTRDDATIWTGAPTYLAAYRAAAERRINDMLNGWS